MERNNSIINKNMIVRVSVVPNTIDVDRGRTVVDRTI